ncbi:PepSY domain-containing protein [Olivibacter ginsenosidimutans]|uniref:PepSY domain-containing protein n=2 Tax=Olivibacter ginsenosidimutans TaxID=1176537 RepID=A0ABP9CDN1_9SPHI
MGRPVDDDFQMSSLFKENNYGNIKKCKTLVWWHKWTSLICTLFLLLLCVTGLPLVFHEEIDDLSKTKKEEMNPNGQTEQASLDVVLANGKKAQPNKVTRFVFWDDEDPSVVYLSLSDSLTAPPENYKILQMNAYTGELEEQLKVDEGFMHIMLQLHTDLFLGIGGKLFLGLMGILFIIAIISGVVLYGPIMKKYDFGMIRNEKSRRLKWLDMHNLLGIVALFWTFVVGFTGVINTLSDVVLGLWQQGQLAEMTAPYSDAKPLHPDSLYSLELATKTAVKAAPHMGLRIIAMPGTMFTSKHHYAVFMKGNTPLTSRLLMPALVDAKTGKLTDMRKMPWYVNALFLSEPLHFGDYGGLPLKMVWALLDIITIAILITGLYLWVSRLKASKAQLARLDNKSPVLVQEELNHEF